MPGGRGVSAHFPQYGQPAGGTHPTGMHAFLVMHW